MKKIVLCESMRVKNHAGFKYKTDVQNILISEGYTPRKYYHLLNLNFEGIPFLRRLKTTRWFNSILKCAESLINKAVIKSTVRGVDKSNCRDDSSQKTTVVVLYPVSSDIIYEELNRLKQEGLISIIAVIIDIDVLRDNNPLEERRAKWLLNCDGIIAQNSSQENFIKSIGYNGPVKCMWILDFIGHPNIREAYSRSKEICYGGSLAYKQSGFIYDCDCFSNYYLNVYGTGLEKDRQFENSHIRFCGEFLADEVIYKLQGDFGLVWNGTSVKSIEGTRGEYYKYASPHKLSMYIMAGMPVIVNSKSAISEYVYNNNIGIVVDSLENIEAILDEISNDEYEKMLNAVRGLQGIISNGDILRGCIGDIVSNE